jgi:hypothetical protein
MKNRLTDLNDHLFAQLERLSDEDLSEEDLQREMERSKAITAVSAQIVSNAKLVLDATKAVGEGYIKRAPKMIGTEQG